MSKEFALSKEVAEEALQDLLDFYEIDLEADIAADEGLEASAAKARVAGLKKKLINAIRAGRLEPRADGPRMIVVQTLMSGGDPLKWYPPSGTAKMSIKITENSSSIKQIYDLAAGLTKTSPQTIMKLEGLDLSTAETMTGLFLLI